MKLTKKRVIIGGAVAALALSSTGIAYAYWTTTGTGSGTAATGTDSGLVLHGTAASAVTPGGTTSPVVFTADNGATGPQHIGTITLTGVSAFSDAARTVNITGTGAGKCDTNAYSMVSVGENVDVPSGLGNALPNNGSLVMSNTSANQDGCKNAFLTLTFTSN